MIECEIVADYDQRWFGAFVLRIQTTDRVATQIHVGLRFDQRHAPIFNQRARDQGLAFAPLDANAGCGSQFINEHEPQIVSGLRVFISGIAESDD
jgi:hypothetical protein